jgi:hypothetical protein
MTTTRPSIQVVLTLAIAVLVSCNEELPPYIEPTDLLSVRVEAKPIVESTMRFQKFTLIVKNIFDETLEGRAAITGSLIVWLADSVQYKKTFSISAINLAPNSASYNPATGRLSLDAGQTFNLILYWDLSDDAGKDLVRVFTAYPPYAECFAPAAGYRIHTIVRVSLFVFESRGKQLHNQSDVWFCFNIVPV